MRIALYNLHFATLGGGERRTALLAAHLAQAHEIMIFSASPLDMDRINDLFGIDLSRLSQTVLPALELHHSAAIAAWKPDLFINNSHSSHLPCPAPRGIYMCMFPEGQSDGLEGYQIITANSAYTQRWIAELWGRDSEIVYSAVTSMGPALPKEKIILNVGRFQANVGNNHFKHQDLLRKTFHRLQWQIESSWEMHFVGIIGSRPGDLSYAETQRRRSVQPSVNFHFGLSQTDLRKLYRRATLYWHATGYGDPDGNYPERQEHLGMTVLEAMSAGAIPLAFRGGGPCETIVHETSGFLWTRPEELIEHTRNLIANPDLRQTMSDQAIQRSRLFDKAEYLQRMDTIISRILAS